MRSGRRLPYLIDLLGSNVRRGHTCKLLTKFKFKSLYNVRGIIVYRIKKAALGFWLEGVEGIEFIESPKISLKRCGWVFVVHAFLKFTP